MNREEILKLYEESTKKIKDSVSTEIENLNKSIKKSAELGTGKVVCYNMHPLLTPHIVEYLEENEYNVNVEENEYGDNLYIDIVSKPKEKMGFLAIHKNRIEESEEKVSS